MGAMTKTAQRICAVAAGIVLLALAVGGYLAWGIADFYHIAAQIHFRLALLVSAILLALSAYWATFAAIGYRRWSARTNHIACTASLIMGVSGGCYVIWLLI